MVIKEIKCKSILNKSNLPEVDYCINPYVGCLHKCVYCYASFMRRFTGHNEEEWGSFLDVRMNAVEVLKKQINPRKKRGPILIGSVTDAYQPIERKYGLTRGMLEVLVDGGFSVSILTKSDVVLRDLDLLSQIDSCEVGLTITSLNSEVSRIFEPGASIPKKRLEALSCLKNKGIKTYAFVGPILPEITNLPEILKALQGKVDFIMFETLNVTKSNKASILQAYSKLGIDFQEDNNDLETERIAREICSQLKIPVKGFYRH